MKIRFKKYYGLFLLFVFLLVGCNPKEQSSDNQASEVQQDDVLESISAETMQKLFNEADYMDIIFYSSPVSVSQDDKNSIKASLRYISEKPVSMSSNCKPVGRLSFMIAGDIDTEADIYFSEGCQYFIFIEGTKPVAGNYMTPEGIHFFQQVLSAKPPTTIPSNPN